jgi:hypothetical protein
MTKLELAPDGYGRITEKIQAVEDIVNKGLFNPDAAVRCPQEAYNGPRVLRQTLDGACLLVPDAAGPPGPDAAQRGIT